MNWDGRRAMAAARKVGKGMIEKALVGAVAVAVVKGLKGGPRRPDNAGPDNDGDRVVDRAAR